MATVEIREENGRGQMYVGRSNITDWITGYKITPRGDGTPKLELEMDVNTAVEITSDDQVKYSIKMPDNTNLRRAIYEKLKQEFEVSE